MDPNFIERLKGIVVGLTYPSESDEPLNVFTWPATAGSARGAVQKQSGLTSISEIGLDTFFGSLQKGNADAERVSSLRAMIDKNLTGICVFRVHRGSEIDIYLIGKLESGEWAALRTMSVET